MTAANTDQFGNWLPATPATPSSPLLPQFVYPGTQDNITYAGPPLSPPPAFAYQVVDINNRVWIYSQSGGVWQ